MIAQDLKYPLTNDNIVNTLLLGTLMVILTIFIIPIFTLMGYYIKVINHGSRDLPAPEFKNYFELTLIGVKYAALMVVYVLTLGASVIAISAIGAMIHESLYILSLIIAFSLYMLYLYLIPAILYQFAKDYRISDAFNFNKMFAMARSLTYAKIAIYFTIVYPIIFVTLQFGLIMSMIGIVLVPASIVYELISYGKVISNIKQIDA